MGRYNAFVCSQLETKAIIWNLNEDIILREVNKTKVDSRIFKFTREPEAYKRFIRSLN